MTIDYERERILEYARLAGEFLQKKDPTIQTQLRGIEKELDMNHRQIMEAAMGFTDLFGQ